MTWNCLAIDHGVTIYPNGQISPCCWTKGNYLKPISALNNPDRFADLKTETPPDACERCVAAEHNNMHSYRKMFESIKTSATGLQFVDIRNTNLCNLKCRFCGPHFSSQWAKELAIEPTIKTQDISSWKSTLISDDLHWLYFTGGEPLISHDHWEMLQDVVDRGLSKNITLIYNSNFTTTRYKDIDIQFLWKQFKKVVVRCSIDAIGKPLEYIRSGASWEDIDKNIQYFKTFENIEIKLAPVIGILNFWFLPEFFEYATKNNLPLEPVILFGPDYLALDVIPDELKNCSLEILEKIKHNFKPAAAEHIKNLITNNENQVLFGHTVNHILFLDSQRNEKLFDLLPFKDLVVERFIKNHEYE
jgi:sulfatase maturation enzyme AslB (radical SAM superfamily)